MSIQPPSDLILDVVKAADPVRAQAIAARLKQASAVEPAAFENAFAEISAVSASGAAATGDDADPSGSADATEAVPAPPLLDTMTTLGVASPTTLHNATVLSSAGAESGGAYRRFEAMVLTNFVDAMLPAPTASMYGTGTAGQVWRSMLAERIADEVARAGGIGLAARMASTRPASAGASI